MIEYSQEWCIKNMHNEDYWTRYQIAHYIEISYLPQMMNDKHWHIRYEVARRIDKRNAFIMSALDEHQTVRECAWNNVMGLLC
jgi:hypothetical protein